MKLIRTFLPIAILFLGISSHVFSQKIEISKRTEFIGNKYYYIHTVKPGETIYELAKAYSVDIRQIYSANPESVKGIQGGVILKILKVNNPDEITFINHYVDKGETLYKIATNYHVKVDDLTKFNAGLTDKINPGQLIKIPLSDKPKPEPKPAKQSLHIVQKGESLFAIAKLYNITVDELKKLNPGLTDNLQLGQQIKVPYTELVQKPITPAKDTIPVVECGKTGILPSYTVALMIPFYLERADIIDTANTDNSVSTYQSLLFIQFYEGIRQALDSLDRAGLSLKIYTYDVTEDAQSTEAILKKPEFASVNLIIGPLFSKSFQLVANWAKQHAVPIINPFTNQYDLIKDNPFAFKLNTSFQSETKQMIDFVETTYPDCNLLIVHNDKEKELADSLKKYADAEVAHKNSKINVFKVDYSKEWMAGVTKNLSDANVNVIITLIDGEAFVSSYLRNLNELAYQHKIVLFAEKTWEDYSSLDVEYLMNLNTHIYSNSFINYQDTITQHFVLNFRDNYKTDPNFYAFQGYDIMLYFGYALKHYGKSFPSCLNKYNPNLLETTFKFKKIDGGGYENVVGTIYRYENYKAINAILNPKREINLVEKKKP